MFARVRVYAAALAILGAVALVSGYDSLLTAQAETPELDRSVSAQTPTATLIPCRKRPCSGPPSSPTPKSTAESKSGPATIRTQTPMLPKRTSE